MSPDLEPRCGPPPYSAAPGASPWNRSSARLAYNPTRDARRSPPRPSLVRANRRPGRLTDAMSGTDLTILVALAAGVISFLSPCVLPLVPAYLGQLTAIAVAGSAAGATPVALAGGPSRARLRGRVRCRLHVPRHHGAPSPPVRWSTTCRPCATIGGVILIVLGLDLAGLLHIPRPAADVATARRRRGWIAGDRDRLDRVRQRRREPERRGPDRRPRRQLARRLARVVRPRGDLRDRLEPVHRDHPRRDPDDGRDVRHGRPGRRPAGRLHARARAAVPAHRRRLRPRAAGDGAARPPRPDASR